MLLVGVLNAHFYPTIPHPLKCLSSQNHSLPCPPIPRGSHALVSYPPFHHPPHPPLSPPHYLYGCLLWMSCIFWARQTQKWSLQSKPGPQKQVHCCVSSKCFLRRKHLLLAELDYGRKWGFRSGVRHLERLVG